MSKKNLGFEVNGKKLLEFLKAEYGTIIEASRGLGFETQTIYLWARKGYITWEAAGKLHYQHFDVHDLVTQTTLGRPKPKS